ncbi:MAG TPA: hypothetical protein VHZ75_09815 [Solirubrobacteraceae bacterium]|jgi:hypothetical protein|nr:hypothetical protein [Solirubrobacteraceae bacterium]
MRHVRLLAVSGIVAGVGGGAIAAAAIPQTTTSSSASVGAPAVIPAPIGVRRVAAARKTPTDVGFVRIRAVGPMRVSVRVADPRGGPAWAVREFLADRLAPDEPGIRGGSRVIGRNRCVQLGRVYKGRFGWLTADGTFRPVTTSYVDAPTQCLSRRPDMGGHPFAEAITTITDPRRSAAEPLQTVVYALAGAAARDARLSVAGKPAAVSHGPAGTLLAVLSPAVHSYELRLTASYPKRADKLLIPARGPLEHLPARMRRTIQTSAPGAVPSLAAQAPDPDGGLPFGMTATKASVSGFCTSTGGRVVDDRVGGVDYDLDLMRENSGTASFGCPPSPAAARSQRLPRGHTLPPYSLGSSFGGGIGVEPGEDPRDGSVARRTAPGRVVYSGTADADVRYLTFATPSDVRTIAPWGPAHAFLIVYAGSFPTGDVVITTTFKDGHTRRDVMPNFGI